MDKFNKDLAPYALHQIWKELEPPRTLGIAKRHQQRHPHLKACARLKNGRVKPVITRRPSAFLSAQKTSQSSIKHLDFG